MEPETKKTILISIWCTAAVLLVGGAVWLWIYLAEFSSYHDNQYKFTVQYPVKWKKVEKFHGTAVTFIRPQETALDVVLPNVNITVQEVPDKIATMESFSQTITKQMAAVFKNNINILEDKDATFAGRRAHRLVIVAPNPNHLKMTFIWTMKGPFAYIFTFMAQEAQYVKLSSTVKRMINSFELK